MTEQIRVTIWNEFIHEQEDEEVKKIYPDGIHNAIAGFLEKENDISTKTATLQDVEHGLSEDILDETDVLIWWGHIAHDKVKDEVVERVKNRVLEGMGLIVLHSGAMSKLFRSLMGTTCNVKWRHDEKEIIWCVNPGHPIVAGLENILANEDYIELGKAEMYGEFFDIPEPDELVFVSWFEGGEVFRSGCCFHRGHGKIFYFKPGHETCPHFHDIRILQVLANAVRWAKPVSWPKRNFGNTNPVIDVEE